MTKVLGCIPATAPLTHVALHIRSFWLGMLRPLMKDDVDWWAVASAVRSRSGIKSLDFVCGSYVHEMPPGQLEVARTNGNRLLEERLRRLYWGEGVELSHSVTLVNSPKALQPLLEYLGNQRRRRFGY